MEFLIIITGKYHWHKQARLGGSNPPEKEKNVIEKWYYIRGSIFSAAIGKISKTIRQKVHFLKVHFLIKISTNFQNLCFGQNTQKLVERYQG